MWFGDGRFLLWSDIPNNRILKWEEETGAVSVFRKPSDNANGNTRDRQGRLVTCEHGARRVTRTEHDGTITVLCNRFDGKPLNSPNDVVVKSDGSIWFTDPPFGILGNYEGNRAEPELPVTRVYRVDGRTGRVDGRRRRHPRPERAVLLARRDRGSTSSSRGRSRSARSACSTSPATARSSTNGRDFADVGDGTPDGFRCDVDGNLWCGWGMSEALNGVAVFAPDGTMIGRIALPERCANLCFGGVKRNRLFMAASHSLYAVYVNTEGAIGG